MGVRVRVRVGVGVRVRVRTRVGVGVGVRALGGTDGVIGGGCEWPKVVVSPGWRGYVSQA